MISFQLQKRFWEKVEIDSDLNKCWEWKNYLDKDGYGTFYFNGTSKKAHRFSYEIYNDLDDALDICHTCDNPSCVNPTHLFTDTHADNMKDMKDKKRSRVSVGDLNTNAKLNENEIKEAFNLILQGIITSKQDLMDYNINFTKYSINKIINRKTWTHITKEYDKLEFEHIVDVINGRLTRTDVFLIKNDLKLLNCVQISKKYSISLHTVFQIKGNRHKYC